MKPSKTRVFDNTPRNSQPTSTPTEDADRSVRSQHIGILIWSLVFIIILLLIAANNRGSDAVPNDVGPVEYCDTNGC